LAADDVTGVAGAVGGRSHRRGSSRHGTLGSPLLAVDAVARRLGSRRRDRGGRSGGCRSHRRGGSRNRTLGAPLLTVDAVAGGLDGRRRDRGGRSTAVRRRTHGSGGLCGTGRAPFLAMHAVARGLAGRRSDRRGTSVRRRTDGSRDRRERRRSGLDSTCGGPLFAKRTEIRWHGGGGSRCSVRRRAASSSRGGNSRSANRGLGRRTPLLANNAVVGRLCQGRRSDGCDRLDRGSGLGGGSCHGTRHAIHRGTLER
jgi:hypothetical protein